MKMLIIDFHFLSGVEVSFPIHLCIPFINYHQPKHGKQDTCFIIELRAIKRWEEMSLVPYKSLKCDISLSLLESADATCFSLKKKNQNFTPKQ